MKCSEKLVFQLISLLIILWAIITVMVSVLRNTEADSVTRFCLDATPGNVYPGPGEAGGQLTGFFQMDTSSTLINYNFRTNAALSPVMSLVVMGPIPLLSEVGPVAFSLCGAPNMVNVCDIVSVPGQIVGELTQLEPGAMATLPWILAIRENPTLYYLEVRTSLHGANNSALRAPFYSTCGFP